MKVLVTGAAGFIGAHVIRQLIAGGHDAVAAVRPGSAAPRLADVRARCSLVELDVADAARVAGVLREHRPDAVIHLAWYAEPGRYRHALAENVDSLRATAGLLLAAAEAGCPRVVLGGSCVEHAVGGAGPIYDAAKAAAHRLGEGFSAAGLRVACGHVFYLYGPWEDRRRVLSSVIRSLLANQPIATTTGEQTRDYLHVADVAAGFIALAGSEATGGVDICSGSLVTLADVLRIIGEQMGRPALVRLGERGSADDDGYQLAGDPRALIATGWRPQFDIRSGITDTIAWWTGQQEALA